MDCDRPKDEHDENEGVRTYCCCIRATRDVRRSGDEAGRNGLLGNGQQVWTDVI
jgi:hypothetical protein